MTEQQFDRNTWQTPKYVFNAMNRKYRFDIDGAADVKNALCEMYITKTEDITDRRTQNRIPIGSRVWINPPYSDPMHLCARRLI